MSHPSTDNRTPFNFEPLLLNDEEGRPLLVPLVKATFDIGQGVLKVAEQQLPVDTAGKYRGAPDSSSLEYEPECAFFKAATDVVLLGHAHAPSADTTEVVVSLRVGPVHKAVRVIGERVWFKSLGQVSKTRPLRFERIPLVYERAFGGWDRSDPDSTRHSFELRNPVGVSFRTSSRHFEEGLRLPNLEAPEQPLESFGQVVPPAGFGFISPHWQPRAALAGTHDEAWRKQRMPLLPRDFDRRFFNAASPGLIASSYLRGDEPVTLVNASSRGRLSFMLPGVAPQVTVELASRGDLTPAMHLDTVILDTQHDRVLLLWRGMLPLREFHEVRSIEVRTPTTVITGAAVRPGQ